MKYLLLLLLALIIWWVWSKRGARVEREMPLRTQRGEGRMLVCAACQVHFPEEEAVVVRGKHYCCAEHAKQLQ